jgi:hypothetical protein
VVLHLDFDLYQLEVATEDGRRLPICNLLLKLETALSTLMHLDFLQFEIIATEDGRRIQQLPEAICCKNLDL